MESEFLSQSTQKLRKSLLIASLIGYAISKAGLTVAKVSLLGSELAITKFEVIPFLLGVIVTYLLVTFIFFGLYDYYQSNKKLRLGVAESISKGIITSSHEAKQRVQELDQELMELNNISTAERMMWPQEKIDKVTDRKREIEYEIRKLQEIQMVLHPISASFVFEHTLRTMRTTLDLYIPIMIGFYVSILLFYFTKIPKVEAAVPKPGKDVVIGLRLSLDDANNIASYSLIENSESGGEDKPASNEGD